MFSLSSHGCSFLVLFDDCYFADCTFAAIACGRFYHVDATCHLLAFQVFAIPSVGAAIASALVYQDAIGCYNFYIGINDKPVMVIRPV